MERGTEKKRKRIFKVTLLFETLFFSRRFLTKPERERERNSKDGIINRRRKRRKNPKLRGRGGVNKEVLHRFVERNEEIRD